MKKTGLRHIHSGGKIAAVLFTLGLAGCGHDPIDSWLDDENPMPVTYESRHPIQPTTATESTTIRVSVAGSRINGLERQQVEAFGQAFRSDGEGVLAVNIPAGTVNEKQAASTAREVRQILISQGLPAKAIIFRPYQGGPGTTTPPLLLSYRRVRATVSSICSANGDIDIDYRNLHYENFGCSTQNNFAAQLANPDDLVAPRPMNNTSATRRATVLDQFNKSGNKELKGGSSTSGASGS